MNKTTFSALIEGYQDFKGEQTKHVVPFCCSSGIRILVQAAERTTMRNMLSLYLH